VAHANVAQEEEGGLLLAKVVQNLNRVPHSVLAVTPAGGHKSSGTVRLVEEKVFTQLREENEQVNTYRWVVDTGATNHMTGVMKPSLTSTPSSSAPRVASISASPASTSSLSSRPIFSLSDNSMRLGMRFLLNQILCVSRMQRIGCWKQSRARQIGCMCSMPPLHTQFACSRVDKCWHAHLGHLEFQGLKKMADGVEGGGCKTFPNLSMSISYVMGAWPTSTGARHSQSRWSSGPRECSSWFMATYAVPSSPLHRAARSCLCCWSMTTTDSCGWRWSVPRMKHWTPSSTCELR
jgi:hypothetical protein